MYKQFTPYSSSYIPKDDKKNARFFSNEQIQRLMPLLDEEQRYCIILLRDLKLPRNPTESDKEKIRQQLEQIAEKAFPKDPNGPHGLEANFLATVQMMAVMNLRLDDYKADFHEKVQKIGVKEETNDQEDTEQAEFTQEEIKEHLQQIEEMRANVIADLRRDFEAKLPKDMVESLAKELNMRIDRDLGYEKSKGSIIKPDKSWRQSSTPTRHRPSTH